MGLCRIRGSDSHTGKAILTGGRMGQGREGRGGELYISLKKKKREKKKT